MKQAETEKNYNRRDNIRHFFVKKRECEESDERISVAEKNSETTEKVLDFASSMVVNFNKRYLY